MTYEGVFVHSQMQPGSEYLLKHGRLPGTTENLSGEAKSDTGIETVVVIGRTSVIRRLSPPGYARYHKSYQQFRERWNHPPDRAMTRDDFASRYVGWTNIRTWRIPLVGSNYETALVPSSTLDDINGPNKVATVLYQSAADLIAAETNGDGVLVVTRLLCTADEQYDNCAESFEHGLYDKETGRQLNKRLRFKSNGRTIDVDTYRVRGR